MDNKLLIGFAAITLTAQAHAESTLPAPTAPIFKGKIDLRIQDSTPDWPKELVPTKDSPNILIVMLDDTGFGASSTFGGPIPTPNFDRIAKDGLKYTQMHTTALSSPTRAALLTGRNHHSAHAGTVVETATGYPGYDSISKDTATIAEILKQNGYNTAAFGKWHNTPDYETSAAGPFDRWPTWLGFEYFYGFLGD